MFAWQAFLTVELAPHPLNQFSKTATLDPRSVCTVFPSSFGIPLLPSLPSLSSLCGAQRHHLQGLTLSRTPELLGADLCQKGAAGFLAVKSGFPTFTGLGTLSSLGRDKENKAGGLSPLFSPWDSHLPCSQQAAGPPPMSAERAKFGMD